MSALTIVFLLSFLGVISMLLLKLYELKKQRAVWALEYLKRHDGRIEEVYMKLQSKYDKVLTSATLLVKKDLPDNSKSLLLYMRSEAKRRYSSIMPNIRGIRVLKKEKEASKFLQDIFEHKESNGKGSIE